MWQVRDYLAVPRMACVHKQASLLFSSPSCPLPSPLTLMHASTPAWVNSIDATPSFHGPHQYCECAGHMTKTDPIWVPVVHPGQKTE